MVLVVVRQGGWTAWAVTKRHSNESLQITLGSQRTYENGQGDSPTKESTYFSRGILKRWDVEDEVKTTVLSQIHATVFIHSSHLITASEVQGGGGTGNTVDGQLDTYRRSQLDSQILAKPTYNEQGLQLFCNWGRQIKLISAFAGNSTTLISCALSFSKS
jgi:hypothetical protein